ncbi:MAG: hypothetical protein HOP06_00180 [Methylotenera sp.]|nr:hypothetical protein [Methylotenera sp.]
MNNNKIPAMALLAVITLANLPANAEVIANLKVVQQAAQTGLWTSVLSGTMPDGSPAPNKTETVCASKAEILQNFNHALYWDTKTGQEQKECPTKLTTNTSTLGVASMTCPAQTVVAAGKTFKMPSWSVVGEFKQMNKNQWTIKMGNMLSTVSYHGSASASCIKNRK